MPSDNEPSDGSGPGGTSRRSAPVQIGIIGCGTISTIYLQNLTATPGVTVSACADLVPERAGAQAAKFGVPWACSVDELLGDPEIELVLNLTIPIAHATVAMAAIAAGKSVYNEKPLAIELEDGRRMLDAAAANGVLVGCAPDTFLGAGLQTCRKVIDDGLIGQPIAASAALLNHGPEHWHPDPAFYYAPGGGPMFDMGPYYLTALVALLGPVRRVTGSARISMAERTITSQPHYGETITVAVPTHVTGILDFASGAIGTIATSFDTWTRENRLEIYGTEGTLGVPDPNTFGGPVHLRRPRADEWEEIPLTHDHAENSRGIGPADLAAALREQRPPRASGQLAYHVLDIMHAVHDASLSGRHVELDSTVERPAPRPAMKRQAMAINAAGLSPA